MKCICRDQRRSKIRIALHMPAVMLAECACDQNKGSGPRAVSPPQTSLTQGGVFHSRLIHLKGTIFLPSY